MDTKKAVLKGVLTMVVVALAGFLLFNGIGRHPYQPDELEGVFRKEAAARSVSGETVEEVLKRNVASQRDDAIRLFIEQAKKDRAAGYTIILGGDFNEPSHQDWTEETKDLYDHHGFVIPWTVPVLLDEAGLKDAYREFYPDVLNYPGFTYPSDNPAKPADKITWAPKADERDRIDYIWYYPEKGLKVKDAAIFGPKNSIVRAQRVQETSKDKFIEPLGVWPTDHKGVLVTFQYPAK